ncbi:MAG: DUF1926 domain-containing protein [Planctomycetes bacterium]|nr:DUF1926 domain-containing protein [Planctomycetota bacterium]
MPARLELVIVTHIHQPVGNFDHVVEDAYQHSYLPFLTELEMHATMPQTLHVSGCLYEWLDAHHPEYVDRLSDLAKSGLVEIMAGGFFEPVLTMLEEQDRSDQIALMRSYIRDRLGVESVTAWVTERVWEQGLVRDLVDAGIQAVVVDDFHFKCAGLTDDDLTGPFLTEDQGRTIKVFPGSEHMRYLVPFHDVSEVIAHLRTLYENGCRLVTYADDGEKFGVWPGTYKLAYEKGWLKNFFAALEENRSWLSLRGLGAAAAGVPAVGRIYLPDASYREMTEWALPAKALRALRHADDSLKDNPIYEQLRPFVRGGTWRNFRVKYPEIQWMYGRMLDLSRRSRAAVTDPGSLSPARLHILRSQCNCAWWHGVFGGLYLPHLRGAIWKEILAGERLLGDVAGARVGIADIDLDSAEEAVVENRSLSLYVDPGRGGIVREIDVLDKGVNLLDTLARRYEAYHEAVLNPVAQDDSGTKSIHEQMPLKQDNLDKYLFYDRHLLACFLDYFMTDAPTPDDLMQGRAGDPSWWNAPYSCELLKKTDGAGVSLRREGVARSTDGRELSLRVKRRMALDERAPSFAVDTRIESVGGRGEIIWGPMLNFNFLSASGEDRGYRINGRTGGLADEVAETAGEVFLFDQWRNIGLKILVEPQADIRIFPLYTVSASESGLELVYQATAVLPFWRVALDKFNPVRTTVRLEFLDA